MLLQLSVILFTGEGGGVHPHPPGRHPLGRHPPPETATVADFTHPTGMYSCYVICSWQLTSKIAKYYKPLVANSLPDEITFRCNDSKIHLQLLRHVSVFSF